MLAINPPDLDKISAALLAPDDDDKRAAALAVIDDVRKFQASPELLDEARELYASMYRGALEEDDVSFDDAASTSPSDAGTFVSCWFWVPNPADDEDEEEA